MRLSCAHSNPELTLRSLVFCVEIIWGPALICSQLKRMFWITSPWRRIYGGRVAGVEGVFFGVALCTRGTGGVASPVTTRHPPWAGVPAKATLFPVSRAPSVIPPPVVPRWGQCWIPVVMEKRRGCLGPPRVAGDFHRWPCDRFLATISIVKGIVSPGAPRPRGRAPSPSAVAGPGRRLDGKPSKPSPASVGFNMGVAIERRLYDITWSQQPTF